MNDAGYCEMAQISVILLEAKMQEVGLYPTLPPTGMVFTGMPADGGNQNPFFSSYSKKAYVVENLVIFWVLYFQSSQSAFCVQKNQQ